MSNNSLELHERITAGRLLTLTAAQVSAQLDSFCSWLLIGVGGAYALILANFGSLERLISIRSLQISMLLLLVAIVLGVLQRWLAAIVAATAAVEEKAEQIGSELSVRDIDLDFKVVFREMERGTYYPAKWMLRSSFDKALSGDFAASGRLAAGISQIQSAMVGGLVLFVVSAIAVTVCGVRG